MNLTCFAILVQSFLEIMVHKGEAGKVCRDYLPKWGFGWIFARNSDGMGVFIPEKLHYDTSIPYPIRLADNLVNYVSRVKDGSHIVVWDRQMVENASK